MKKAISMAMELLGHKLRFGFQIEPDGFDVLRRRNEKVVRDYEQGYMIKRLAEKYNLTENRISQILTAFGVRKPKWHKMSKETRRTIFQLKKKGLSKAEIGRKVGVSRERVRQILQTEA